MPGGPGKRGPAPRKSGRVAGIFLQSKGKYETPAGQVFFATTPTA